MAPIDMGASMNLLFGFSGRIRRGGWWLGQLAIVVLWVLVITIFALFAKVADPSAAHGPGELSQGGASVAVALVAGFILSLWINFATTIKRYHDLDKSGAWSLMLFAPFIGGIWVLIECGFLRGSPGGNGYGPAAGEISEREIYETFGEIDEKIARMKAERSGQRPAVTTVSASREPSASAPVRRPAAPTGFGRRGL
jgi:uncharacterized membrane protein YhaH (DUF805 family)